MLVSLKWLCEYFCLGADAQESAQGSNPSQHSNKTKAIKCDQILDEVLSATEKMGLETESVINWPEILAPFVVALIEEAWQHPNADGLRLCRVFDGKETFQVVCGASNARTGIKVVLAPVGSKVGQLEISERVIRGQKSAGMLCSSQELGLPCEKNIGIVELPSDAVVGSNPATWLGLDDIILHLSVTPNMARTLSVRGLAREIALFSQKIMFKDKHSLGEYTWTLVKSICPISIQIDNPEGCKFASGVHISGINNSLDISASGKSTAESVKRRLESIGVHSINPVVDIVNYCMYELGQPMHAYDASKIGDKITITRNQGAQSWAALDGKTYQLDNNSLVVISRNASTPDSVASVAGVIGGLSSCCLPSTQSIFLESALFSPVSINKTVQSLGVRTQSSYRFERILDPACCLMALSMAARMICEICGGIQSDLSIAGTAPTLTKKLNLSISYLSRLSGASFSSDMLLPILSKAGISCKDHSGTIECILPSWLMDFDHQAEIAEEALKIVGYDFIRKPTSKLFGNPHHYNKLEQNSFVVNHPKTKPYKALSDKLLLEINAAMGCMGYNDSMYYSFIKPDIARFFVEDPDNLLAISNPISEEMAVMRPSILPGLLMAVIENNNRGVESLSLSEIGAVYDKSGERIHLTALRSGPRHRRSSFVAQRMVDIFDIKADLSVLIQHLSIDPENLSYRTTAAELPKYLHPWRSAAVFHGAIKLGYIGDIHPEISDKLGLKTAVSVMELDYAAIVLAKTSSEPTSGRNSREFSKFQRVMRDFAFILPTNTTIGAVIEVVRNASELLRNVEIFDIYKDETKFGGEFRSVALSITLQADDRTLTEDEINVTSERVIASVADKLSGQLRDGSRIH